MKALPLVFVLCLFLFSALCQEGRIVVIETRAKSLLSVRSRLCKEFLNADFVLHDKHEEILLDAKNGLLKKELKEVGALRYTVEEGQLVVYADEVAIRTSLSRSEAIRLLRILSSSLLLPMQSSELVNESLPAIISELEKISNSLNESVPKAIPRNSIGLEERFGDANNKLRVISDEHVLGRNALMYSYVLNESNADLLATAFPDYMTFPQDNFVERRLRFGVNAKTGEKELFAVSDSDERKIMLKISISTEALARLTKLLAHKD